MAAMMDNQPVPLWIDNEAVTSNITFPVLNVGNGREISAFGATTHIAKAAIDSSSVAFQSWRNTTPWERRALLQRAAQLLSERSDEVERILEIETSVDDVIVSLNLHGAIDQLQELASHCLQATDGVVRHSKMDKGGLTMILKEPLGVQLAIAPWNASILLAIRAVATPIACGNTAILKASELSPLAHHFLGTLFRDAGFPPGVLNIVQHRREDAAAVVDVLISDSRVRKVNFTGSTQIGRLIASKAAQHGKPCLLELGGKCPQVVLDDADLDKAVQAAAFGAIEHHGQICMSTERIIVDEKVMDKFAAKLSEVVGKTRTHSSATEANVSRVEKLLNDALDQGAKLLGEGSLEMTNASLKPQIVTNVTTDMEIWRTETFGPVAVLCSFKSLEEAISLANDSDYGLSASIFTADAAKAIQIARRIDSGAVHINSTTIHDEAHLPHGGTKASGWGRFGSPWGFDEFTQLRTVTIPSAQDI